MKVYRVVNENFEPVSDVKETKSDDYQFGNKRVIVTRYSFTVLGARSLTDAFNLLHRVSGGRKHTTLNTLINVYEV